jgi:hypothetical protein
MTTALATIESYRAVIETIAIGGLSADGQAAAVELLDQLGWERSCFLVDLAAAARQHDLVDRYGENSPVACVHRMENPRLFSAGGE